MRDLKTIVAGAAGVAVFLLWMSTVGNPHVVETVLGLVLGVATFAFVRRAVGRRARNGD